MKTVEMRKFLREKNIHVPRNNADVVEAYNKAFGEDKKEQPIVKIASSNIYTYIGSGDEPPHMINFMGMQKFVRGIPVEVSPEVAKKIKNNRSFVKGKYDMELAFENDQNEKEKADKRRELDRQIDLAAKRKYGN